MNKYLPPIIAVLISLLNALPAMAQPGQGWRDDSGFSHGPGMRGMRGGMMNQVAPGVPSQLPAPENRNWVQRLKDVLAVERLSFAQYNADAKKFNAHMPYSMVIGQEEDHVRTIERLFSAYGMPVSNKQEKITETKTLAEALELCVKLESDLIPKYEWLVRNAEDRQSAAILDELLFQTRHHMFMFQRALSMGGGMGPMGSGMGSGMMQGRY